MTAPKPKVWSAWRGYGWYSTNVVGIHSLRDWCWRCPRCHTWDKFAASHDAAIQAATAHSRTHTAERIADALEGDVESFLFLAEIARTDAREMEDRGRAWGMQHAAAVIREHLT